MGEKSKRINLRLEQLGTSTGNTTLGGLVFHFTFELCVYFYFASKTKIKEMSS
jgi:hypothetical protein